MRKETTKRKGFTLVEIMIVVVIIGLLATMAVPTWQRIRKDAQDKTITNNLRQLYSAAQQYFLESGQASVAFDDLVGTGDGRYIKSMATAAGEDYSALLINVSDTSIQVAKSDGSIITYSN